MDLPTNPPAAQTFTQNSTLSVSSVADCLKLLPPPPTQPLPLTSTQTTALPTQTTAPPRPPPPSKSGRRGRPPKQSKRKTASSTRKKPAEKKCPTLNQQPPTPKNNNNNNNNNNGDAAAVGLVEAARWALPVIRTLVEDAAALSASAAANRSAGSEDVEYLTSRMRVIRLRIALLESVMDMIVRTASWTLVQVCLTD